MNTQYPLARKDKLVVRELPGEVLVYDLIRNKALCLNRVAGAVWKQCDGTKAASRIAEDLSAEFDATIEEQTVWDAIDQLGRDDLLQYCVSRPANTAVLTRRQQLQSLGRAAAIAGPVVAALTMPTAQAAQSCIPNNQSCVPGGVPCCKGVCTKGKGAKSGYTCT